MSGFPTGQIEAWEDEGGAAQLAGPAETPLTGSGGQVEWALRIRRQVGLEFDRVAAAFRVVALRQSGRRRAQTQAIISILEEKRLEVMDRREAGYFIRGWQEIGDQVRQLVFQDSRYQAIQSSRVTPASAGSDSGRRTEEVV